MKIVGKIKQITITDAPIEDSSTPEIINIAEPVQIMGGKYVETMKTAMSASRTGKKYDDTRQD